MNHRLVAFVKLVGIATALCCVVGCTSNEPEQAAEETLSEEGQTQTFLDVEGASAEYLAAAATLPLPPGYTFPKPKYHDGPPEGTVFQPGVGEADAMFEYMCVWETEYLRQFGAGNRAEKKALKMLDDVQTHPFFLRRFDQESSASGQREMVAAARLGDPSIVQASVKANCDVKRDGE